MARAATTPKRAAGYKFTPSVVPVAQGGVVVLANVQTVDHDMVSDEASSSGRPLFSSDRICCGWTAVTGASELARRADPYAFHGSLHPWMRAGLLVS